MTPGQLIDLLEKAGMLKEESPGVLGWHPTMQKVERFAALLRAEEREACAKVVEADGLARGKGGGGLVLLKAAERIRASGEK